MTFAEFRKIEILNKRITDLEMVHNRTDKMQSELDMLKKQFSDLKVLNLKKT